MTDARVRTLQSETVDALCWRHYGRTQGAVEAVLQANPGLASFGLILPQGCLVTMPQLPQPATKQLTQLWD